MNSLPIIIIERSRRIKFIIFRTSLGFRFLNNVATPQSFAIYLMTGCEIGTNLWIFEKLWTLTCGSGKENDIGIFSKNGSRAWKHCRTLDIQSNSDIGILISANPKGNTRSDSIAFRRCCLLAFASSSSISNMISENEVVRLNVGIFGEHIEEVKLTDRQLCDACYQKN